MAKSDYIGVVVSGKDWEFNGKKGFTYRVLIKEDFNDKTKLFEKSEIVKVSVESYDNKITDGQIVSFSGELKTYEGKSSMSYKNIKINERGKK